MAELGQMMTQQVPGTVVDHEAIRRAWRRVAHEVIERQPALHDLTLVGIVTRGYPLAERLARYIEEFRSVRPAVLRLDVRGFRDDQPRSAAAAPVVDGQLVAGRPVLVVDDVLFHGRTVRAAVDALVASGRPRSIQLAVLVDRGHRELPIRPDYVGKNLPTGLGQWVEVRLLEVDGEDAVRIVDRDPT